MTSGFLNTLKKSSIVNVIPMENINNAKQNVIIGVVMKLKNAGFVSANPAESTVHNGNKLLNNAENFENESIAVAAETRSPPFPIVALRFCMKPLLFVFVEFVANIKVFEDDDDSKDEKSKKSKQKRRRLEYHHKSDDDDEKQKRRGCWW